MLKMRVIPAGAWGKFIAKLLRMSSLSCDVSDVSLYRRYLLLTKYSTALRRALEASYVCGICHSVVDIQSNLTRDFSAVPPEVQMPHVRQAYPRVQS